MAEKGVHGSINLTGGSGEKAVNMEDLSGRVHLLPCSIKYDGPCNVAHYFKPKPNGIEVDGLRMEEAHFRGRKLQGTTMSIPDGYCGFVLGKKGLGKRKALTMSEGSTNCWESNTKFKSISYWSHDSLPSQDDPFVRSFHWLAVAEAMHKPVAAEDLMSASIALEKLQ